MTDVFQNETPAGQEANDPLANLIGEGKKYANEQEALKALVFSQEHISKLETELAGLRSDLDKRLGAEEILASLKDQGTVANTPATPQAASEGKSGLTKEDVLNTVNELEAQRRSEANRKAANKMVADLYGEKGKEAVTARASQLGMSVSHLQAIAEESPEAFKTLLVGGKPASTPASHTITSQGLDTAVQSGSVAAHGTKAYYDQIRSSDPKLYWSPATQNEMHKAAQANPDKFFGR